MKRNLPPFSLGPEETARWRPLLQEVGGMRAWQAFRAWRLPIPAQHQAAYFAVNLPNELIATMCQYRREFGQAGRPDIDSGLYQPITRDSALRRAHLGRQ